MSYDDIAAGYPEFVQASFIHQVAGGACASAAGWFVVASLPPCFEPPTATNGEHNGRPVKLVGGGGPRTERGFLLVSAGATAPCTLINTLLAAGFVLGAIEEPQAPAEVMAAAPVYGEVAEVLTLRARTHPR